MSNQYPRIHGYRRKPNPDKDGSRHHGKPCINCGAGTIGEKWVQYSYMRGEDETVRICWKCWDISDDDVIKLLLYPALGIFNETTNPTKS